MEGTKAYFILLFLVVFCGTLIHAQNEKTDSILSASRIENTLISNLQDQIQINFSPAETWFRNLYSRVVEKLSVILDYVLGEHIPGLI